jgi:hypothetical protein
MTNTLEILRDDEPDPGRWQSTGVTRRDRVWHGPLMWSRRRGATLITYFRGIARRAEPVVSSDGNLVVAVRFVEDPRAGNGDEEVWGVLSREHWIVAGTLEFVVDGRARFVTDQGQFPADGADSFALELAGSVEISMAISDRSFATALYASLCNVTWMGPHGVRMGRTFRDAAGLVAALRGEGEGYLDFYCSAREGVVRADVAEALQRIGWRRHCAAAAVGCRVDGEARPTRVSVVHWVRGRTGRSRHDLVRATDAHARQRVVLVASEVGAGDTGRVFASLGPQRRLTPRARSRRRAHASVMHGQWLSADG